MTPGDLIRRYGITHVYHFTDRRNLDLIREHGLLPLCELRRLDIEPPAPGGNQWSHDVDEMRGFDEYVHVCLIDEHPMEYRARQDGRINKSVFLRISPDVLLRDGVLYAPGVANKRDIQAVELEKAATIMDFEVVYDRLDWRNPAVRERRQNAKKYEILIPGLVPLSQILSLK